jgi:WD40 repeat protein
MLESRSSGFTGVAATPDESLGIFASKGNTLMLWNLKTDETVRTLKGHSSRITAVATTSDGRFAVSGSMDGTLKLWDLETGEELRTVKGSGANAIVNMEDGQWYTVSKGSALRPLKGHFGRVVSIVITPDGRLAVSADNDGILLWNLQTGENTCVRFGVDSFAIRATAITSDGRFLVFATSDGNLTLFDMERKITVAAFGADSSLSACAISRDGRRIVAGEDSGRIHILRLEGAEVKESGRFLGALG